MASSSQDIGRLSRLLGAPTLPVLLVHAESTGEVQLLATGATPAEVAHVRLTGGETADLLASAPLDWWRTSRTLRQAVAGGLLSVPSNQTPISGQPTTSPQPAESVYNIFTLKGIDDTADRAPLGSGRLIFSRRREQILFSENGGEYQAIGADESDPQPVKPPCAAATTNHVVSFDGGAPSIVDGYSLLRGDRVLVRCQDIPTAAKADLQFIDPTLLHDGETVTIDALVYEFDFNGSVAGANVQVDVSGAANAADVAGSFFAALQGDPNLLVEQDGNDGSILHITAASTGPAGNDILISETVVNSTFVVPVALSGGRDSSPQENGIYTVVTVGSGVDGVWARAADVLVSGNVVYVAQGDTSASTGFVLTTPNPFIVGTDPLVFENVVLTNSVTPSQMKSENTTPAENNSVLGVSVPFVIHYKFPAAGFNFNGATFTIFDGNAPGPFVILDAQVLIASGHNGSHLQLLDGNSNPLTDLFDASFVQRQRDQGSIHPCPTVAANGTITLHLTDARIGGEIILLCANQT